MRYELRMNAIPDPNVSIDAKHEKFEACLRGLPLPWGLRDDAVLPRPDLGTDINADVRLSGRLGPGIRGFAMYTIRRMLLDEPVCDDLVSLEFNPKRNSPSTLLDGALQAYIEAFDPYFAKAAPVRDWTSAEFEAWRQVNGRYGIYKIAPIHYVDDMLCQRAFGLSPEEARDRLAGHVERVDLVHRGVLIVSSSGCPSHEEADAEEARIRSLLAQDSARAVGEDSA